jgi:fructose-1-phosphate kinase PfkB-like protein
MPQQLHILLDLTGRPSAHDDDSNPRTPQRERFGGHGACVVTCGVHGIALVDDTGAGYQGVADQSGPYPVGSGDAVLGALAVARTRGETWDAALRAAVGAGAANAARPGAGVVDLTDARAVARMLTVRRVGA